MTDREIKALSIGNLKAILFRNHVNARLVVEKEELVSKVKALLEDERRERADAARRAEEEERETQDRIRRLREQAAASRAQSTTPQTTPSTGNGTRPSESDSQQGLPRRPTQQQTALLAVRFHHLHHQRKTLPLHHLLLHLLARCRRKHKQWHLI